MPLPLGGEPHGGQEHDKAGERDLCGVHLHDLPPLHASGVPHPSQQVQCISSVAERVFFLGQFRALKFLQLPALGLKCFSQNPRASFIEKCYKRNSCSVLRNVNGTGTDPKD